MKTKIKIFSGLLLVTLMLTFVSCNDDKIDPEPLNGGYEIIQGNITNNLVLDASNRYLIRGKVYVQNGAKITIPAGTMLFGEKNTDGTLIINRGGQIDAQGTASNPIVFTSQAPMGFRNRGDWGGIVILGKAYSNNDLNPLIEGLSGTAGSKNGVYGPVEGGTPQDTESSGIMKYVRIEFAGIDLSLDNELNSLTMGGVGSGTQIDHIMVSYANDDAYEWFGGSINHKYLIAYSTLDDDFDTDRGFIGKIQYGYVVRDPLQADVSGSRAFESSSNSISEVAQLPAHGGTARHSAPVFSNITVLGPRLFRTTIDGFYQAAIEINSSSNVKIHNSIITGFPTGIRWNAAGTNSVIKNNVFSHHGTLAATGGGSAVPANFATENIAGGDITSIFGDFTETSIYSFSNPPFFQAASSPYLTGAPNVNNIDPFFENQPFYGASGASAHSGWNWNSGWINWNPINTNYAVQD